MIDRNQIIFIALLSLFGGVWLTAKKVGDERENSINHHLIVILSRYEECRETIRQGINKASLDEFYHAVYDLFLIKEIGFHIIKPFSKNERFNESLNRIVAKIVNDQKSTDKNHKEVAILLNASKGKEECNG